MKEQQNQEHLFSLYAPNVIDASWVSGAKAVLKSQDLIHRMTKVLRFDIEQQCVLFDQYQHAMVVIQNISKKEIIVDVIGLYQQKPIDPHITFLLPLLKKEALEQAVYSLCELGINQIQLVVVQKSRHQLMGEKEFQRLQNIVIAAAEQSKQYAMLQLLRPKPLAEVVTVHSKGSVAIVFDPAGKSFFTLREKIASNPTVLLVGPEAGLTDQELQLLEKNMFLSCALTSTTLRAVQAVALGAGLVRLQ